MTNSVKDRIERELNKIFDDLSSKFTKTSFILSKLDLSYLSKEINRFELKFSTESLLKLHLYKKIKGVHHHTKISKHLLTNEDEALDLGFNRDKNNIIQIPKKRTINEFLQLKLKKEVREQLDTLAQKILSIANKKGIILDLKIVKKQIEKHNHKIEKRNTVKEATKLVKKLIYPEIQIKLRHNAKFTTKDLLDVLVHIAYSHDFTNNGSNTFQELYPDEKAPSGDLMLHHFNKFNSTEQIQDIFNSIFDVIFDFAKKNYKLLNCRKVDIAYDVHKIPYYGNKNDLYVTEGKPERGTSHFYQFLTASIVMHGQRFTLDAIPIHKLDNIHELIDESLKRVKEKVRINRTYLDRGFDKPKIINVIKAHNIKFIMPKVRSLTVKAWMRKSSGIKSRVIEDFEIGTKDKAIVNLILIDDKEGIKRAFITNFHIPEQLTHYLFKWYSKRWGIETGYRNMDHDFKAKTTSKNYHIRLFYFLFSVALYNLWVLVNIVVSIKLFGRLLDKPLLTAKLFAVILYRVSYEDPPT